MPRVTWPVYVGGPADGQPVPQPAASPLLYAHEVGRMGVEVYTFERLGFRGSDLTVDVVCAGSITRQDAHTRVWEAMVTAGMQAANPNPPSVMIARCAQHGLHGERVTCFECGHGVEQVPMVPVPGSGYKLVPLCGVPWLLGYTVARDV